MVMDKRCFRCGATKGLSEFYAHPRMADGHLNKCKDCAKNDASEFLRRKVATPDGLEAERARGREKYRRLYRVGPNWTSPPATRAQRIRASSVLARAVRSGKILRPRRCEDCGVIPKRIHGHHEDYNKPLAVIWVCSMCHRRRHAIHPERVKTRKGTR